MLVKLGVYRHYKGNEYRVVGVARHSETHEELVVYHSIKDAQEYWVRPLDMFLEDVIVGGISQPRFIFISE